MNEPTIALVARLRTRDGTEISHPCSFTPNQWRTLEKFADYAAEMSRTALVSTGSGLSFSLMADDDGVRFEPKAMPDSHQVSELLHRMRPFVLKDEPTYFPRVRKILVRRLDHPAFESYLARQKEIFEGRRQQAMLLRSNGQIVNSVETLDLWLNAYEYHRDDEKRAAFEALHDDVLPIGFSRALLIGIILDRVRAILEIGNAIYTLQRNLVVTPFPGDSA